jgi:hypothetical protein
LHGGIEFRVETEVVALAEENVCHAMSTNTLLFSDGL